MAPNSSEVRDAMPEAEVSLLLALHLVRDGLAQSDVSVALDGAQVRIGEQHYFDVPAFMIRHGWHRVGSGERWQGRYQASGVAHAIEIHSSPGLGDVTTVLAGQRPLIVEAKKGSMSPSKSSAEYKLMREALGQLLTLEAVPVNAVLAVAVPHGERFVKLAERWRRAPLIAQVGILIVTVCPTGKVYGLTL
jgi:hypothetical protein